MPRTSGPPVMRRLLQVEPHDDGVDAVRLVVAAPPADGPEPAGDVEALRDRVVRPHLEEHPVRAALRGGRRACVSSSAAPVPSPRSRLAHRDREHVRVAAALGRQHRRVPDDAAARPPRRRRRRPPGVSRIADTDQASVGKLARSIAHHGVEVVERSPRGSARSSEHRLPRGRHRDVGAAQVARLRRLGRRGPRVGAAPATAPSSAASTAPTTCGQRRDARPRGPTVRLAVPDGQAGRVEPAVHGGEALPPLRVRDHDERRREAAADGLERDRVVAQHGQLDRAVRRARRSGPRPSRPAAR